MRARAELGRGATLAGAVAADCVPDLFGLILRVSDLAGAAVLSGAEDLTGAAVLSGTEVLAGAADLSRAGVFSVVGVWGAGCSGVAGAACPAEAGSGIAQTSGSAGPFPLLSMLALLLLAPVSSVVLAPLVGTPESGASCWAPVSMWTSGVEGSC
jgi:hypothetical protein